MTRLNPYLVFDGTTAEAMRFYQRVLGGKLDMVTHAETLPPDQVPPGYGSKIMHASLDLGGSVLMAADWAINGPYEGMRNFSVSLMYDSAAEAQPIFDALSEAGNVTMPFQKTFWAEGFGMVTDRFGTPWMVNAGMGAR
jgi:PhnB protein